MDTFLITFLGIVLTIALATDIRFQRIPNLLTFPAMVTALCYHAATGGLEGFLFSGSGLVLGTAIFFIPFLLGGMGAGDAKLMGAVGAAIGPKGVLTAAVLTCLFGGIYALIILIIRRELSADILRRWWTSIKLTIYTRKVVTMPANKKEKQPKLCYGIAIVVGTLFYVLLELSGYKFPI
jgi:prepilin peptidase CpaA